jgi:glycogen debranching enzyme
MADLTILHGATFFYSEPSGDVDATHHEGFFHEDVRHLSLWQLVIDGKPIDLLTGTTVDYFSARIVGRAPGKPVTVRRDRFVTDGFHEDLVVDNDSDEPQSVRLEIRYDSDFADVIDAQRKGEDRSGLVHCDVKPRSARLWEQRDGYRRETNITFRRHGRLTRNRMVYDLELPARGRWTTCIDVAPVVDGDKHAPLLGCDSFGSAEPKMEISLREWLAGAPQLETDDWQLASTYRQSLLDLAALRIRPSGRLRWAMPAGGLPWFMTVFGRDSILASYQALPFQPHLAAATLECLADLQATEFDHFADAEPGKIVHEVRRGIFAGTGRIPRLYYGTHDATLLFLILLDEYERWTGDTALVRKLEQPARAAIEWMDGPADQDGDGWLEYRKRSSSPTALDNHCWKDSDDSMRFADGRLAEPPIASCEIQGYAYDARRRSARLARTVWRDNDLARRLERDADTLKRRFNRTFWDGRHRQYALALDARKERVDAAASNMGHLLWSGIVDERRAGQVVHRLLRKDLFSGWGIRSLSGEMEGFDPLGYHTGCVWPHDTAIVAEGMRRFGFRDEASLLAKCLLDAAAAFENRLPEVFSGFERDGTGVPVPYPDALVPQAWSAGAPLLALRTILGLDAAGAKVRSSPHLPRGLGKARLRFASLTRREPVRPT